MNTENKTAPVLRFPEFKDEWETKKLKNVAGRIITKNRTNDIKFVLTNSATRGIISQQDYFDKDIANQNNLEGYYVVEKDDFVYNPRISSNAPVGPIKRNKIAKGLMSPLYSVFRFKEKNLDYFEHYFESVYWHKYLKSIANYGARHDRMNITVEDFFSMPFFLPSEDEKQKISVFLTTVDKKIQQLTKKKNLLEQYKKGVMQKIFNQEIRFKDNDWIDFADWEEKNFEEIYVSLPTKQFQILASEILESGKLRVIDQGQNKVAGFSNESSKLFKDVPIIIFGDHTAILKYIDFNFIVGADGTKILKNKFGNLKFFYYCLVFNNIETEGYKRHFSILKATNLRFPDSVDEQKKIADFLSAIDDKINLVNQELEKTRTYKKGLLQQMFI